MLESVSVVVLEGGDHDLLPFPPGAFQLEQCLGRRLSPFRKEYNEREGLEGVLQETLKMADRSVQELFTERRIGLERAALRSEFKNWTTEYRRERKNRRTLFKGLF